jgi:dephospho-CoA kinase
MLRVGLTGGIGSGKSTVADFFAARGVPVIDTDQIAHELVAPGEAAYRDIVAHFGNDVLDANGALDRIKLRARVFDDAGERERLESILHPRIRAEVKRRLNRIDKGYAIVVVPLLIETGFDGLIDRILVVDADEALQVDRVAKRSGMTATEVGKIMTAQATRQQRLARADDIIENSGGLPELEQRVAQLHQRYLALAGG